MQGRNDDALWIVQTKWIWLGKQIVPVGYSMGLWNWNKTFKLGTTEMRRKTSVGAWSTVKKYFQFGRISWPC